MLITPERKVPQRSDASQNDHKSKGYPSTMPKDTGAYRRLGHQTFLLDFLKSGSTALHHTPSAQYRHHPTIIYQPPSPPSATKVNSFF